MRLSTKAFALFLLLLVLLVPLSFAATSSLQQAKRLDAQVVRLYRAGRFAEAVPLARRSLVIWKKALGPEHPQVATGLTNLANLYRAQGRYKNAEPLYKRALAIWRKALGHAHPKVATALNNLAELYRVQGRYKEAEEARKRSESIRKWSAQRRRSEQRNRAELKKRSFGKSTQKSIRQSPQKSVRKSPGKAREKSVRKSGPKSGGILGGRIGEIGKKIEGGASEPVIRKKESGIGLEGNVVSVFYGTDRNETGNQNPHLYYGGERGKLASFGICEVSIPPDHRVGVLETPYLRFFQNPKSHVILRKVNPLSRENFLLQLRKRIRTSSEKDAFLFIHGYNVTFENSCRRTAQISYDLKFKGAPIMWSWPSDGKVVSYIKDEADVAWTKEKFEKFLLTVSEKTGAKTLHIIAHSMGNRALVNSIKSIVDKQNPQKPIFNQIVLVAPDFDAGTFQQIAGSVRRASERMTIYSSSKDKALGASARIHGATRLGLAGPHLTIINGIDTIDASTVKTSFLGHSYFAEKTSVIADIYEMLILDKRPKDRFHLKRRLRSNQPYWEFRP